MPYVSCRYAPPPPPEMQSIAKPGGANAIICTDENGVEWHLTDDSEVGDWLRYAEAGGTVLAADAPAPTEHCD
jgi:hypothetical protein